MKTDVISVSSRGRAIDKALRQADSVAVYKELSPKGTLHLRLLAEEMMGLMRSITGETDGWFWIEDEAGVYQLHLQVETRLDSEKREKLLSASTSGKNEAAKGLMGRLRNLFDMGADTDVVALTPLMSEGFYEHTTGSMMDLEWSMMRYREGLSSRYESRDSQAVAEWDELEKSVVAHVADEVKVFIRGSQAELVIYKKLA